MQWTDMAIELIKRFEGCELHAYPDPAKGWDVPTIGYGATGRDIKEGTVWTQDQADADLVDRIFLIGNDVSSMVSVSINDAQKAALVDFAYNLGSLRLRSSTLLSKLNEGDYDGACDQFGRFIKSGTITLRGLVARRAAEAKLFKTGEL